MRIVMRMRIFILLMIMILMSMLFQTFCSTSWTTGSEEEGKT